nr:hypothetical protein [Francisella tularensis]
MDIKIDGFGAIQLNYQFL